jgi:hypothetical protein
MTNKSWRHHYLPVFYLKGFTNPRNKFKIYDVEQNRFIKNGKDFPPESYFFKKNGNTLAFNGELNDILETDFYSIFDSKISRLLNKINSASHTSRYNVSENDMPTLNHFVSLMYWRLPHQKNELEELIRVNNLNTLGLSIKIKDGENDPVLENEFKKNTEFIKGYKFYNSLMDSIRGVNCRTPFTILESTDKLPFICSDNPVIYEKQNPKVFEDDYLFPLSGNRLFIKGNRRSNFDLYLRTMVDTLVFKQAKKNVCCTNEKSIEIMNEHFEKSNLSIEELKFEIFKKIK